MRCRTCLPSSALCAPAVARLFTPRHHASASETPDPSSTVSATYGGSPLSISRRQLAQLAAAAALPIPAQAQAQAQSQGQPQSRRETLVIGLDITDTITFDPARLASYTTPLTLAACYDTLVTMAPGHYDAVIPSLATRWERLPNTPTWRFTLDPAATFASGAKLTAEDCRFSLDRARRAADGAGQFVTNIATIAVSGPTSLDIELRRPDESFLATLASPQFAILERAQVEAQGANATEWLNQHSAGSGPFVLSGWARRQSIQLTASPHPWRAPPEGKSGFRRVTIANMPYPAAQLRAIQKGDIDVAFNLIPEQIDALRSDRAIRIQDIRSLDFVYLALTADPAIDKPLSTIAVRQAFAAAIDYEDLLGRLLGGTATRPANFLPVGVPGSTEAVAARIGYRQDLARARTLLREAGFPDNIEIRLSYPDDAIAGITYHALARKLQTDLGRVGIKLKLDMRNPATLRADYLAGKLQAVLAFWHPPVIENRVWAEATIDRVGKRLGWTAPNPIPPLIADASAAADPARAATLWADFQSAMVEQATLIPLFQPTYQVAIRTSVAKFPLTGAGWMADLAAAQPAQS